MLKMGTLWLIAGACIGTAIVAIIWLAATHRRLSSPSENNVNVAPVERVERVAMEMLNRFGIGFLSGEGTEHAARISIRIDGYTPPSRSQQSGE